MGDNAPMGGYDWSPPKTLTACDLIEPKIVSPLNTATPLFEGVQYYWAYWVLVQVRSMGDATYIGVGNHASQNSRFLGVGDFQIFDVPLGCVFNAAKMFAISDYSSSAPVIEVSGMFPAVGAFDVVGV